MCTAIKHPVADRVKPSFVIFDIRALWCWRYRLLCNGAPIIYGAWRVKWSRDGWRRVTQKGQGHDPIMFDAHYLENGWRYRLGCNGVPIGNGVWRVEWSGARCRRVYRSSYSELITYCHSTFTIDKIAWKYRKTANITEKASVYHTVNGNRALFHTSKTAKTIKVILLSSTLTFWQGALSNITFIIFAVFDVWNKAWLPLTLW